MMRDILLAKALSSADALTKEDVVEIIEGMSAGVPLHSFEVNEEGDLLLKYDDNTTKPKISMDEEGNLIYEF